MWGKTRKKQPATAQELVSQVEKLVSLPEVYFLIREKLADPLCSVNALAAIIQQDAGLTARLLKLGNSPYFGYSNRVDTVSRAISIIGIRELEFLVLATAAVERFSGLPVELVNMASFWRHSIFTGVLSRLLARQCNVLHHERLFVAGLLHDVGKLIIYHELPDESREILAGLEEGDEVYGLEYGVLGFDHAEVGERLSAQWRMPLSLQKAIGHHHSPADAGDFCLEASIVHVANMMAHAMELKDEDDFSKRCEPFAWQLLKLPEARIKPMFQDAVMEFIEVLELLQPGAAEASSEDNSPW